MPQCHVYSVCTLENCVWCLKLEHIENSRNGWSTQSHFPILMIKGALFLGTLSGPVPMLWGAVGSHYLFIFPTSIRLSSHLAERQTLLLLSWQISSFMSESSQPKNSLSLNANRFFSSRLDRVKWNDMPNPGADQTIVCQKSPWLPWLPSFPSRYLSI